MVHYNLNSNMNNDYFTLAPYGSGTIVCNENNEYIIDNSLEGDRQAFLRVNLKKLKVGDLIKVEYECVNCVGSVGVGLEQSGSAKVKYLYVADNKNKGMATITPKTDGDYNLIIGGFWNTNLKGTIKNINITITSNSVLVTKPESVMNILPQKFTIQSTAQGVFEIRTDWSTHSGVLSNYDTNTLKLVLDIKTKVRPQVFINNMYPGASAEYTIRTDIDTNKNVFIRFYDNTNTLVPISNVKSYVYFGILVV